MRRRVALWVIGLLVVDVALAVALLSRAWAHPTSVTVGGATDAPYTIWALTWVARALTHGYSPWITRSLSWPAPINLLTNATVIGLDFVLVPITLVFGPLLAYNVAATSTLAVTAWSAQVCLRRSTLVSWPAAAVGGLVAGFGPLSLVETGGDHLHVSAAFLVPPMLLGIGRLATGTTRRPILWAVAVGALAAGQLLIGEEVLAITAITVAVAIVVACRWVTWRSFLPWMALALGVFGLLAVGPLLIQYRGAGHILGELQHGDHYSNDLTAFVVPAPQFWLRTAGAAGITRAYSSEGGSYLGIPLLLVGLATCILAWRQRFVRVLGFTALAVMVLSLGSRLRVDGHRLAVPLPWALVARAPVLDSLLPVRFGIALDLLFGAMLAVALDGVARRVEQAAQRQARRRRGARRAHAASTGGSAARTARRAWAIGLCTLLAVGCLLPLFPRLPFKTTRWTIPAAFRSPSVITGLGVANNALVVLSPYPGNRDPEVEVWLAIAGDQWRSAGGSYFVPSPTGQVTIGGRPRTADVVDIQLASGALTAVRARRMASQVRAELRQDDVAAILVGPGRLRAQVVAWWTWLLGRPVVVGGLYVWILHPPPPPPPPPPSQSSADVAVAA